MGAWRFIRKKYKKEVENNMLKRGYISSVGNCNATHVAGKMSPEEYRTLRKDYPKIDEATFDKIVGFNTNTREELALKYSS